MMSDVLKDVLAGTGGQRLKCTGLIRAEYDHAGPLVVIERANELPGCERIAHKHRAWRSETGGSLSLFGAVRFADHQHIAFFGEQRNESSSHNSVRLSDQ